MGGDLDVHRHSAVDCLYCKNSFAMAVNLHPNPCDEFRLLYDDEYIEKVA